LALGQQLGVEVDLVVAVDVVAQLGVELGDEAGLDEYLGALVDADFALVVIC
jgi:hypothetical protein